MNIEDIKTESCLEGERHIQIIVTLQNDGETNN